ncbi:hypothetical protein [Mucilaginibacter sp. SP1R1]|uniref:hypothetical protein n=1 Tax=Mucilaginibacter sp. SP1R1 TaxID=2723091 RepID=UPI00161733D7|nr:hypothetical protein [Mucilaginibacter sp. SP1R1]MBB6148889.1 hypothetical protein [Mucilaginibacter sp. SP1R1]
MKKVIYALILPLVVLSGLVFANREIKNGPSKKLSPKPLSVAERKAELKKWEASPDGIKYKKWEASTEGKKVHASADKIRKQLNTYTNMEAVIISLSRPAASPSDYCVVVRINGDDYLLNNEPQQLQGLKVNDKIIIRSHSAGCAPKYPYLIIWGDYIERDGKIVYKRAPQKGGC